MFKSGENARNANLNLDFKLYKRLISMLWLLNLGSNAKDYRFLRLGGGSFTKDAKFL